MSFDGTSYHKGGTRALLYLWFLFYFWWSFIIQWNIQVHFKYLNGLQELLFNNSLIIEYYFMAKRFLPRLQLFLCLYLRSRHRSDWWQRIWSIVKQTITRLKIIWGFQKCKNFYVCTCALGTDRIDDNVMKYCEANNYTAENNMRHHRNQ